MKRVRNISWIVFFLSFCFVTFILPAQLSFPTSESPGPGPSDDNYALIVKLTFLTGIASFFTATTATIMTYREGKLEKKRAELDFQKTKLEIENLHREAAREDSDKEERQDD